jgi:hypothetical protein
MVAGALKVYSWKNRTLTTQPCRDFIKEFLEQNLTFSVKSMENSGYGERKQVYYWISKLLKQKKIRKTNRFEYQGEAQKPLMIYEVVKNQIKRHKHVIK